MDPLQVGDTIQLKVTKITLGKDGQVWVTVTHPDSPDHPTFRIVEVPIITNVKCPLDSPSIHPRCLSLIDSICTSSTGLCEQAKKHRE
jgi:hypothetical protein